MAQASEVTKDVPRATLSAFAVKVAIAMYWRYDRQCPVIALESQTCAMADVLAITRQRMLIETEIKVSLADLRKDIRKPKHYWMRQEYLRWNPVQTDLFEPPNWPHGWLWAAQGTDDFPYIPHEFYFAMPGGFLEEAKAILDSTYPYAGLLLSGEPYYNSVRVVTVIRPAYSFKRPKVPVRTIVEIVRDSSSTVCRLALQNYEGGKNGGRKP